jgi:hypothetical protein
MLEWPLNEVQRFHLGQDEISLPEYVEMDGEDAVET